MGRIIPHTTGVRISFDETITPTLEMFLQGVGSGLGMQDMLALQLEELTGLEEVGDEAVGAISSIQSEQAALRITVVVFRREKLGAVLMLLHPQGLGDGLPPTELADTLDRRIMDALEATR